MLSQYASLSLSLLDVDEQSASSTTLGAFAAGKPLVLDLWHTRCVRCPDAISKLEGLAPKHPGVTFAACCLSLGSETEGTQEQVLELLEGQWEGLQHLYMTFAEKEAAKKAFGFSAVPFVAVFGADGALKYAGDPKGVDFGTVIDAAPAAAAAEEQQLATDLAAKASVAESPAKVEAPALTKAPLAEANGESPTSAMTASLGFGNDDEDF